MTHDSVDTTGLQAAIKMLLNDRFSGVRIVSVSIESEAFEDDNVIEITVFFEGTLDALVKGQPSGLFGMVRNKVAHFYQQKVPSPVFNFICANVHA